MPTHPCRLFPGWRTLVAGALTVSLSMLHSVSFATDVLVITDSRHPVNTMGDERLIVLDAAHQIETELSAELPSNPVQATTIVRHRLANGGAPLQQRLASAYQDITDAWSLGITSIPAIVVDQRYVVYGEPDVARALARIQRHLEAQP